MIRCLPGTSRGWSRSSYPSGTCKNHWFSRERSANHFPLRSSPSEDPVSDRETRRISKSVPRSRTNSRKSTHSPSLPYLRRSVAVGANKWDLQCHTWSEAACLHLLVDVRRLTRIYQHPEPCSSPAQDRRTTSPRLPVR